MLINSVLTRGCGRRENMSKINVVAVVLVDVIKAYQNQCGDGGGRRENISKINQHMSSAGNSNHSFG